MAESARKSRCHRCQARPQTLAKGAQEASSKNGYHNWLTNMQQPPFLDAQDSCVVGVVFSHEFQHLEVDLAHAT